MEVPKVLAFVDGVGAHHREDEVLGELGLEIVDVDLARPVASAFFFRP
jgi:hypothetical protein